MQYVSSITAYLDSLTILSASKMLLKHLIVFCQFDFKSCRKADRVYIILDDYDYDLENKIILIYTKCSYIQFHPKADT